MRHAGRPGLAALGVRTAFNLLGPLTNPAGATRQLVGVPRRRGITELLARAASAPRVRSGRGSCTARTESTDSLPDRLHEDFRSASATPVKTFYLHPADVGLPKAPSSRSKSGDAKRMLNHPEGSCRRAGRAARRRSAERRRGALHHRRRRVNRRGASRRRRKPSTAGTRSGRSSGSWPCRTPTTRPLERYRERDLANSRCAGGRSPRHDRRSDTSDGGRACPRGNRRRIWGNDELRV